LNVPRNPDILIAGFSCVDFSNLNTKKKTLEESGESGQTFSAILGYAERHRPPLIVLENVKGAPWAKIEKLWQKIGYLVTHKIVDTKHFYLPQTRERGYMVCIDKFRAGDDPELVQNWSDTFEKFKRQASSPFTSFTLPQDDWRIQSSQSTPSSRQANSMRAAVDWLRYKIRHQDYRREKGLGHKRPLTNYQDGGICRPPSWTDRDWFSTQVERVWDTIDMNFLRTLRSSGFDSTYKL
jgi:site-specific DNA-cytosine methylase